MKLRFFLLLSLLLAGSMASNGQNMVPNPGFEEYLKESKGQTFMENVAEWFNANNRQNTPLYGTPDHMFSADIGNGMHRNERFFMPYKGSCTAGLISYIQRIPNYREYLSVQLKTPMRTGQTYHVSFYLSSGNHATFGIIGSNGLGAAFTVNKPDQRMYEPLPHAPQFQLQKVFYATGWHRVSFEFTADKPYRYLTFGNFLGDSRTLRRYYSYDIDPQCYFYIDEVSVTTEPLPEEAPENSAVAEDNMASKPTVPPAPAVKIPPLENRPVEVQSTFYADSREVTIKVWDQREVDGDIISLMYNGEWILKRHTLSKSKRKIKLMVDQGKENTLIFFAHTLGDEPPNTASISLKSGKEKREFNIRSDLNYCGAIQLNP